MKKFFKWLLVLLIAGSLAGITIFFVSGIRTADEFEARESVASLVSRAEASPDYVPYQDVSPMLYQATIAIEDARYYSHDEVDLIALVRAGLSQFLPFFARSGGSTIDMQTVKNLYGQFDGTPVWKAGEIVLAHRLEKICTKDQIISLYVNIINYGNNYHGIAQASMGYFGVLPSQLTDGQATMLAGIPQSPTLYNPVTNYAAARGKQKLVLDVMVRNKMITQEEADAIYAEPVVPIGIYIPGTADVLSPASASLRSGDLYSQRLLSLAF